MRSSIKALVGGLILALLLESCSFLKEVTSFGKCEFRVTTLENPEIAGINVSQMRSFSDLGFSEIGIITSSVMRGKLPLNFILNVEARNPNPALAAHRLVSINAGNIDTDIQIVVGKSAQGDCVAARRAACRGHRDAAGRGGVGLTAPLHVRYGVAPVDGTGTVGRGRDFAHKVDIG